VRAMDSYRRVVEIIDDNGAITIAVSRELEQVSSGIDLDRRYAVDQGWRAPLRCERHPGPVHESFRGCHTRSLSPRLIAGVVAVQRRYQVGELSTEDKP